MVSGASSLESGMLVLPSHQVRTQYHTDVASRSDPIFNMEVGVMKPAFNLECKYRVTMQTKEEWARGLVTLIVKGLVWFTDGSRMMEVTKTESMGNPWEEDSGSL